MKEIKRLLKVEKNDNLSVFLLGPRQVGKSTYLKNTFPESMYIDLLDNREYIKYLEEPFLIYQEVLARSKDSGISNIQPVIIDEIQKLPILLDEVHRLIEEKDFRFILCGSSARKLVRGGANMLGGRAIRKKMFPLVYKEIQEFDLLKVINQGKIPNHYLTDNASELLEAYVDLYLKEEILAEGLVRKLRPFSLFLEAVSFSNGELINYANIARDLAVDNKTVSDYFQILVDTLVGHFVYPFIDRKKRSDIVASPKFYLFDPGIARYLRGTEISKTKGSEFGHAFEHFIFTELIAYQEYSGKKFDLSFWRDRSGNEVDFILNDGEIAIEIKSSGRLDMRDLKGLKEFQEIYKPKKSQVVSLVPSRRLIENGVSEVDIYPYEEFLKELWDGEIV